MNNLGDDTTSLSGTGNLIPLAPNSKGQAIPSGVKQASASTARDARAAEAHGGKSNQRSNASGVTRYSTDAVESSEHECRKLLSEAIYNAELLAVYVSRNGIDVNPGTMQGIANAHEHLENGKLIGSAEAAFLKHYRELASAAYPVTVASLLDFTVPQKHSLQ